MIICDFCNSSHQDLMKSALKRDWNSYILSLEITKILSLVNLILAFQDHKRNFFTIRPRPHERKNMQFKKNMQYYEKNGKFFFWNIAHFKTIRFEIEMLFWELFILIDEKQILKIEKISR